MSETIKKMIEQEKIIVIVRSLYGKLLLQLAEALCQGGISLIEVTYDQSDTECLARTAGAIGDLRAQLGDRVRVGAGTVLTSRQTVEAFHAGAEFIISPNTDGSVIETTKALGLVSIPAGMTPSEILEANRLGADYVKVFPATYLGLSYVKDIRAPINHVKIIAAGGINEQNFAQYLQAGYTAAGISGRLTDRVLTESGDFQALTERARVFREIAKSNRFPRSLSDVSTSSL
jgi:2-dehydro-3-deoxyphosphogluconate aldolase/(4S)-4-hydroxy-2-oxoglutarate aldolase